MLKHVFLDLDGTLTDSKEGIIRSIQYAMERIGGEIPAAEALIACIGPPLRDSFARLLKNDDPVVVDKALEFYRERFSEKGMFENAVYPGIFQALEEIQGAGYQMFLATSKMEIFAKKILDYFQLTPFFTGVHGSRVDGGLSDKGDLLAHILETWSLDRSACIMVGDRHHDIDGGKKNGILTAGVSYGFGAVEELEKAGADLLFDSPRRLAAFLKERTAGEER